MPSIEWNKKTWNSDHFWPKNGDEWDDQAAFCKQPYEAWKNSIAENFILNNIDKESTVLEIAPGYGRWTKFILEKADKVILVDLSPKCIEHCKKAFSNLRNKKVSYFINDGKNLSFIDNNSVDFIWSYDSFVHMEKDVIDCYLKEFSRILKRGGVAIIHHAGRNDFFLKFKFIKKYGIFAKAFYNCLTIKRYRDASRSDISKEEIERLAERYNLKVISQTNCWGENKKYNNKLFNDYITEIKK